MLKMMDFVNKKMRHSLLMDFLNKLKGRMSLEPVVIKRNIKCPLIKAKTLFGTLAQNRCLARSSCTFDASQPILPVYRLE